MISLEPVVWNLVSQVPLAGTVRNRTNAGTLTLAVNNVQALAVYINDDNSLIIFGRKPDNNGTEPSFYATVIDISGAYTHFQSADTGSYLTNTVYLGRGLFMLSYQDGTFARVQFSNAKLNNSVPILLPGLPSVPVTPCPGGDNELYLKTFFDSQQQIFAQGFYGNLGGNGGTIGANILDVNGKLLGGGGAGLWNANTARDDFDRFSTSGAVSSINQISNGLNCALDQVGTFLSDRNVHISGSAGPCFGINPTQLFVAPGQTNSRFPLVFDIGATGNPIMDINLPGIVGWCGNSYVQFFGSGFAGFFQTVPLAFGLTIPFQYHMALTRQHLWAIPRNSVAGGTWPVFVAAVPPQIAAQPSNVARVSHRALNNARPISLTGRYKA